MPSNVNSPSYSLPDPKFSEEYVSIEYRHKMNKNLLNSKSVKLAGLIRHKINELDQIGKTKDLLDRSINKKNHDLKGRRLQLDSIRFIKQNQSMDMMEGAKFNF